MRTKLNSSPANKSLTLGNSSVQFSDKGFNLNLKLYRKISLAIGLSLTLVTGPTHALTLVKAIEAAISNNPNQNANQLSIKAAQLEAQAARERARTPRVGFSASGSISGGSDGYSSTSISSGVHVSKNIYDGGVTRRYIKAADLEAKAQEASLSSTDSFIQNTKGSLAQRVFRSFIDVSLVRRSIDLTQRKIQQMEAALPFIQEPDQVNRLQTSLGSLRLRLKSKTQNLAQLGVNFKHITYIELPESLQTLESANEEMRTNLLPYKNHELAFETAKQKNKNYLAKLFSLEATRVRSEAERARMTRPTVDVSVGSSWGRSGGSSSRSDHGSISVNYSFGGGQKTSMRADRLRVQAAQENVDFESKEMLHQIKTVSKDLEFSEEAVGDYLNRIKESDEQLEKFFQEKFVVGSILSKDDIDTMLELMGTYETNFSYYESYLVESLHYRYDLEVTIGILFDSIAKNETRSGS